MMKSRLPLLLSLMLYSIIATAGSDTVEFSADLVQSVPQQGEQLGRMYVSQDRMRMEFDTDGGQLIQIIDSKQQTVYMINTAEKSYMRQGGDTSMMPAPAEPDSKNPCAGMQNITCKHVGDERVRGRLAEKWEFTSTAQQQAGTMTTWLDKQRGIPLRQSMPDGSGMEMAFVGMEAVSGRKTEKWEMTATGAGGQSQVTYQWYDPELKMNIREESPGGFKRELSNIKTGKQPENLFQVPAGYEEISIPMGGGFR